jgi:predicted RNase H-like HicB family nuclease
MKNERLLATVIRIEVRERETLFIAKSPDLPGLIVTAQDLGTLFDGLPEAIEKHYAALGKHVIASRARAELPGYQAYVALPIALAEEALRRHAELA